MFKLLGKLIGSAVRSMQPLMLDLHPIVWKQICDEPLTIHDLKSVDLF